MNSIFSSFDAVCAELLGQTVKASLPCSWNKCVGLKQSQISSDEELKTVAKSGDGSTKEGNPSLPPPSCTRRRQQLQKARFAPELDGLNCFETLVSY